MNLRKVFAVAVSAGVLGMQFLAIFPPSSPIVKPWYWPFLNYPMYSGAHYAGEVIAMHELRGIPCENPHDTLAISAYKLRTKPFWFMDRLGKAAGPASADPGLSRYSQAESDSAIVMLTRLMESQLSRPPCRAQLWEQAFVLGTTEPDPARVSWVLVREWQVNRDAVEGTGLAATGEGQ